MVTIDIHAHRALWERVANGLATDQEKIDFLISSSKLVNEDLLPAVIALVEDRDSQVRYFALQTLILELSKSGLAYIDRCWKMLESDPDEDVRGMSAACIGKLFFNSCDREVFLRLATILKLDESMRVKLSVYDALFEIAGRPPREWPGLDLSRRHFNEADINWDRIKELEQLCGGT